MNPHTCSFGKRSSKEIEKPLKGYLMHLAKAASYVNVVRSRAALPRQTAAMQVKASDMTLDFILDERAREFVGEQLRWFDLKRTEKLIERATKYNPFASPNIKAYHALRPIPRVEIDVLQNKIEFLQNSGYN